MRGLRADGKIRHREIGSGLKTPMEQAQVAAARIQEMVARMQKIARAQYANMDDSRLLRILDFRKDSEEHGPSSLTGA